MRLVQTTPPSTPHGALVPQAKSDGIQSGFPHELTKSGAYKDGDGTDQVDAHGAGGLGWSHHGG